MARVRLLVPLAIGATVLSAWACSTFGTSNDGGGETDSGVEPSAEANIVDGDVRDGETEGPLKCPAGGIPFKDDFERGGPVQGGWTDIDDNDGGSLKIVQGALIATAQRLRIDIDLVSGLAIFDVGGKPTSFANSFDGGKAPILLAIGATQVNKTPGVEAAFDDVELFVYP